MKKKKMEWNGNEGRELVMMWMMMHSFAFENSTPLHSALPALLS